MPHSSRWFGSAFLRPGICFVAVIAVALHTGSTAAGQGKTLKQIADEDKYQIPYDAEKAKKVRQERLKLYRAMSIDVFEKGPQAKAVWAPQAKALLELYPRTLVQAELSGTVSPDLSALRAKLAQDAVKAGCDDPLVRYLAELRLSQEPRPDPKFLARFLETIAALDKSKYGDVHKLYAANNWLATSTSKLPMNDPLRKDEQVWIARFWELFERVAGENTPCADAAIYDLAKRWESPRPDSTRRGNYEVIAAHLVKGKASKYLQLVVEGGFLMREGWDARGNGAASTVTPEGWKIFKDRLTTAQEKFEAAWAADKTRFQAATDMITICQAIAPDRATMETWFTRAMEANPDNRLACVWKSTYLLPKWRGSDEEFIAFCWKCANSENVEGMIPLAVIEMHMGNAAVMGPRYDRDRERPKRYYSHPFIWATVMVASERLLKESPDNVDLRTLYAKLACFAGKYDVAQAQFEKLGKNYERRHFPDPGEYEQFVEQAKKGAELKK